ncbi:unnamed protein product [Cuscuta europaea]|uniref:CCHC-type domain-containing protein n=1 Tax=Cuscuta europaea TaxID=41803 RepID=A0A9P0ZVA7_CUSEU|nr:unnamed protein product [Cuscuta europaea]
MFSDLKFDDWRIRMKAHLCALHDEMWEVLDIGPFTSFQKVNPEHAIDNTRPQMISKAKSEWTTEERRKYNLDNIAKDILYKSIDDRYFNRIKKCRTAKEIWDTLELIGAGDEQEKDNKLTIANKRFDDFKLLPGETISKMYDRLLTLTGEISELGKELTTKEINLKVLRGLSSAWKMKVVAVQASKDVKTYPTDKLISDLKAHEFEMIEEKEDVPEERTITALTASTSKVNDFDPSILLSDEYMAAFARRFKKFMKNPKDGRSPSSSRKPYQKVKPTESSGELLCYNCRQPGHFKADCPHPRVSKRQGQDGEKKKFEDNPRRRKALVTEHVEKDPLSETESSSDSDSDEAFCCLDTETEDLCLMAQSDDEVSSSSNSRFSSVGTSLNDDAMSSLWEEFRTIQTTYSLVKEENSKLKIELSNLRKETEVKVNLLTMERDSVKAENVSLLDRIRDIQHLEVRFNSLMKMQTSLKAVNIDQMLPSGSGLGYVATESGEPSVKPSTKVVKVDKVIEPRTSSHICHAGVSGTKVIHEKVRPEKEKIKVQQKPILKINEPGRKPNNRKGFQNTKNQRQTHNRQTHDNLVRDDHQKGRYQEKVNFRQKRLAGQLKKPKVNRPSALDSIWDFFPTKKAMQKYVNRKHDPHKHLPKVNHTSVYYDYQVDNGYHPPRFHLMRPKWYRLPRLHDPLGPNIAWVPKSFFKFCRNSVLELSLNKNGLLIVDTPGT